MICPTKAADWPRRGAKVWRYPIRWGIHWRHTWFNHLLKFGPWSWWSFTKKVVDQDSRPDCWDAILERYSMEVSDAIGGTSKSSKFLDHELVVKQPWWLGEPPFWETQHISKPPKISTAIKQYTKIDDIWPSIKSTEDSLMFHGIWGWFIGTLVLHIPQVHLDYSWFIVIWIFNIWL